MQLVDQIKAETPTILKKYTDRSNTKAVIQNLNTLVPYFVLFYLAMESLATSYWLSAVYILILSFFIVGLIQGGPRGHREMMRLGIFLFS